MKYRKLIFAGITGLGFGFCIVAGSILDAEYSLDFMNKSFYIKWLIFSVILGILIHFIWEWIEKLSVRDQKNVGAIVSKLDHFEKKLSFPVLVAILLVLWLRHGFRFFREFSLMMLMMSGNK